MSMSMEPSTEQQVNQAKANLTVAQATITASHQVFVAAGLALETGRRPMEVSAVAVKLPALWPDNPAK